MSTPKSPRYNQEQAELTQLVGCQNWEEVIEWFGEMDVDEIEAECNKCWPEEEGNREFAERLYEALN